MFSFSRARCVIYAPPPPTQERSRALINNDVINDPLPLFRPIKGESRWGEKRPQGPNGAPPRGRLMGLSIIISAFKDEKLPDTRGGINYNFCLWRLGSYSSSSNHNNGTSWAMGTWPNEIWFALTLTTDQAWVSWNLIAAPKEKCSFIWPSSVHQSLVERRSLKRTEPITRN